MTNFFESSSTPTPAHRGAMVVLRKLRKEYGYRLVTVASFHHNIGAGDQDGVEHVTVGDGPDEADLAVVNRTRPGDIVVTQDWGLAALVLGKGARCLTPIGYVFTQERIDFQLDERHVKSKHRRAGGRTKPREMPRTTRNLSGRCESCWSKNDMGTPRRP